MSNQPHTKKEWEEYYKGFRQWESKPSGFRPEELIVYNNGNSSVWVNVTQEGGRVHVHIANQPVRELPDAEELTTRQYLLTKKLV